MAMRYLTRCGEVEGLDLVQPLAWASLIGHGQVTASPNLARPHLAMAKVASLSLCKARLPHWLVRLTSLALASG